MSAKNCVPHFKMTVLVNTFTLHVIDAQLILRGLKCAKKTSPTTLHHLLVILCLSLQQADEQVYLMKLTSQLELLVLVPVMQVNHI